MDNVIQVFFGELKVQILRCRCTLLYNITLLGQIKKTNIQSKIVVKRHEQWNMAVYKLLLIIIIKRWSEEVEVCKAKE